MGCKMISTYRQLNRSVLKVAESTVKLNKVVEIDDSSNQVRLVQDIPVITMIALKSNSFITAHNLNEYRNRATNIQLSENIGSMLERLMEF